ncbi:GNAT family N-acetyltransferase [Actinokineospora fastidiosa]|uniref:N-acetyltransferase n=1 Tax=Actinokineospora fastidiosa TaxID=1816 RepID=A0A918LA36_9PSEU|nr:GNAT family N-acetyltransferase [Actinokineospora fastidiosa]GGS22860.1 N-acetyltransferase [Actinokineospora fastidiosa]
MDVDAIVAEHAARVAALDPLLPEQAAPRESGRIAHGGAVGAASYQESPESTAMRTWFPARRHRLDVRVAGPDPVDDLGRVLDRWLAGLAPVTPGDLDCAAEVELPSRDTAALPALIRRGFVPVSVTAVRRAGRPAAVPGPGVRACTPDDLAAMVALNMEVVEYDAQFGKITPRADTREALTNSLRHGLSAPTTLSWLAERDGAAVGLATVQLPPSAEWVQGCTSVSPVGYLETMSVAEAVRGSGIGGALVGHALAALDAAAPLSVLHHALPNPRSTPFWYRHGYRPLWTMWSRRPAIA